MTKKGAGRPKFQAGNRHKITEAQICIWAMVELFRDRKTQATRASIRDACKRLSDKISDAVVASDERLRNIHRQAEKRREQEQHFRQETESTLEGLRRIREERGWNFHPMNGLLLLRFMTHQMNL